jgi:hypothetical protein
MATPAFEPILLFTRRLNALGLTYMVTGGVAAVVYGEPRLTLDVDVVLVLPHEGIRPLAAASPTGEFYCPPPEVLATEAARPHRGHFNLIHQTTGARAVVYLAGDDPLHAWGLARRRRIEVEGDALLVAPPEYVIVRKLEFHREGGSEKHLRDIAGIVRLSADALDTEAIERLCEARGLREAWHPARTGQRG